MPQQPDHPEEAPVAVRGTKPVNDLATCVEILKAAYVCTVAHVEVPAGADASQAVPRCVPMVYAYHEEGTEQLLYLHGSLYWPPATPPTHPTLQYLSRTEGVPVSVTVTLVDGLFVGRAAISTSLNFRSVVVNGIARPVAEGDRAKSFQALTDQIIPGRWSEFRPIKDGRGGSPSELDTDGKSTPTIGVLSVSITDITAQAKTHCISEPEHETQADRDWNEGQNWAGLLPIRQIYGPALPDSTAAQRGSAVPRSVQALIAGCEAG
ncbi:pyridoxamine 5'-phosphate oxidase family protein [Kitasatospora purpeofusca]|uniref:pyridoxamine 5'-phosphate oxidase family protein n=1 Tax=Kitasatospora purpeofusca TaxID=67352 RepID=UPI0036B5D4BF